LRSTPIKRIIASGAEGITSIGAEPYLPARQFPTYSVRRAGASRLVRGVTYQGALSKEEVKTTMERIDALTEDYLDECANLLVFAFNREPWNESWTFETAKEELRWTLSVPGYEGFVSRGEEISRLATGYCEQEGNRRVFCLRTLCVRPDLQGKGVGSSLLRHLEETLKELNVAGIYLLTRKGGQAEAFYRNNGYEVSSEDVVMIREW
jgi:aminoglycoside 6'-N-acetyltransferase I